jgi:hypothetical protein
MARHYARAVDGNHAVIRDGLRKVPGVRVVDTSRAGSGVPDLFVHCPHTQQWGWVEIKVKGGKLTPKEEQFAEGWWDDAHYLVAYSLDDVLRFLDLTTG